MKRSRLRPVSKKRAKLMRKVSPERNHFLAEHPNCAVCSVGLSVDVHEIARGSHREEALEKRETWLAVCRDCHSTKLESMPIPEQLALKAMQDSEVYDDDGREKVTKIRGRAPGAVTESEVIKAAFEMGKSQRS